MRFSHRHSLRAGRRAFTLLEILVVLAIIGMLVGLGITNADKIFGGSQVSTAELFVRDSMKTPLTAYRIDMGGYPSTAEGLQALITAPQTKADAWRGPYIEVRGGKLPVDPWQEPYIYRCPGVKNPSGYDLLSKGADKTEGTPDDIGNW